MENKSKIIAQIHRLQGQLRAVEKMIADNEKPSATIQQIKAVSGSLKSLEKKLLQDNLKNIKDPELKKVIDLTFKS